MLSANGEIWAIFMRDPSARPGSSQGSKNETPRQYKGCAGGRILFVSNAFAAEKGVFSVPIRKFA
jgi:hypothetical protein